MPTGYTCDIEKGISFKTFALQCARAFGACIDLRDEPIGTAIPDEFPLNPYHLDNLVLAQQELQKLMKMTPTQIDKARTAEFKEELEEHSSYIAEKRKLRKKYDTMLQEVEDWAPPSDDHVELKKFMREQIMTSIEHDCNESYSTRPVLLSPSEWLKKQQASIQWNIDYHTREYGNEVKRHTGRTLWVKQLRNSLT